MATITKLSLQRKPRSDVRPEYTGLVERIHQEAEGLVEFAAAAGALDKKGNTRLSVTSFEADLWTRVMSLARLVFTCFLVVAEENIVARLPARVAHSGKEFRAAPAQARSLNTLFGVIRYWRVYMRQVDGRQGYHPLDLRVGLSRTRATLGLLQRAVHLALHVSFQDARETLGRFVVQPPSTELIEKAALGLGRLCPEFVEQMPGPSADGPDGEVLVIMFDSKGVPTAKEAELAKRRGKRPRRTHSASKRHRGREARQRSPRKRRKKGDKSKNARMATQVVMYTLRREGSRLVGPLNMWRYASMAPKRHAFEIAQREAAKRGFVPGDDGRHGLGAHGDPRVQIVIDGDPVLLTYAEEYFQGARKTIDVMHVLGYIHGAATAVHREGSPACDDWFSLQKERLYAGELDAVLKDIRLHLEAVAKTGPGTKAKRKRLNDALEYMQKRRDHLDYGELIDADLEISTGAVEGSIKYVIAKRFDNGGMRWIRERVEALLQLRCVMVNGQWDHFVDFAERTTRNDPGCEVTRLVATTPASLPNTTRKAA